MFLDITILPNPGIVYRAWPTAVHVQDPVEGISDDHAVQGVQHLPVQKLCLFEITLNTTRHLLELHVHAVDPVGKAWQPKALLDRPGRPLGLQVGREPHKVRFQSHQSVQDFVSGIANSAL